MADSFAVEELKKKQRFEARLDADMRRLFNMTQALLQQNIILTGAPGTADELLPDYTIALVNHYIRVGNAFAGDVLNDDDNLAEIAAIIAFLALSRNITIEEQLAIMRAQVNRGVTEFARSAAPTSAQRILNTTTENMATAFDEAVEPGVIRPTNAAAAGKAFKEIVTPRINTIGATETQAASEGAKTIEAAILAAILFPIDAFIEMTKTWLRIGDGKARPAHEAAHNQTVNENKPFIVGGEVLQFPGDRAHGATPGNTINCRCSAKRKIRRRK